MMAAVAGFNQTRSFLLRVCVHARCPECWTWSVCVRVCVVGMVWEEGDGPGGGVTSPVNRTVASGLHNHRRYTTTPQRVLFDGNGLDICRSSACGCMHVHSRSNRTGKWGQLLVQSNWPASDFCLID